jgi:hypothetical protein
MKQRSLKVTCHRRRSWTFLCSHGMIMREIKDSNIGPNSVGKLNVSLQSIKHNNSKGASIRGNYEIGFLILLHSIILLLSFICHVLKTGVDAMATKEVKNRMICENYKKHKLRETDWTPRKTVSRQAPSINQKCSMKITLFLGHHLPVRIYGIFGRKKISFFCLRRNLRTLRKHDKPLDN